MRTNENPASSPGTPDHPDTVRNRAGQPQLPAAPFAPMSLPWMAANYAAHVSRLAAERPSVRAWIASKGFDRVWHWKSRLPDRKGQACRVRCTGRMNSVLVEFLDGFKVVTSRHAVRRSAANAADA